MPIPPHSKDKATTRPGAQHHPGTPFATITTASLITWPVAVLATILAGWLGGALAGVPGFADGGPTAVWGVPIAKTIHDISAAITIGLLLMAGTIIPERATTQRRRTACRIAVTTGIVWTLSGGIHMLLLLSNVSGVQLSSPLFAGQLPFLWEIDLFRVYLFSWGFAIGATALATCARTVNSITWAAALGVIALAVLSLAGHAAGAAAHDTAVNSLAVHIIGASVWFGGLVALGILRPLLNRDFGTSVRRYSALAGWAYFGVLVSGILAASLRLTGIGDLSSQYGLILLAKLVLVVVLGIAGWMMRKRIIAEVHDGDSSAKAFVRLAMTEIVLMSVAMGLGSALSRTAPPVAQAESPDPAVSITGYPLPASPLTGSTWFTAIRIDWLFLTVVVLAVGLYYAAVARLHRRGDRWPVGRTIWWTLGWLFFFWVTSGAPAIYGRIMFSAHMLQHMTLTMGIPLFLVLGAPLTLASRALKARRDKTLGPREFLLSTAHSRWMGFWTNPIVGAVNFVGSIYVFYFTDLYELALTTHVGHIAMVVHFMAAGYVFAWSLIGIDPGPNRWAPSLRLVLLFATMAFHAFFGVAIMTAANVIAGDTFRALKVPYVTDLIADQRVGGGITWAIGEIPMLILALAVAVVWMRADEGEARRKDRQADRDGDAELRAYNEKLAALRGRGGQG
ncbi:cytochrome c oxidase assembly protein [Dermatophilus congolensis]|uniref:cytochrome c oxidase assembly protein n=1 Tax=Dermatophilus congolensis TaxID=1863 RepID=UPI001AAE9875|nr:cytochrome c oxidase assembly protein [Dermatophilus congolensis]MBO3143995.1 cytochrome c oxidase assembly protein [Dermatophilus congolensis]MBO3152985.1 cytochrome c oxidase assembly protein [Dermatophilus congolensis]MBO3160003.1 cytochrome c oxidase assembly protein [Dermatophilus congolensis]MBO3164273.1 cytochrome c oxidase assembly protein [Dermatophilus congolensis]MBO3177817.1 cytochrome c oxidase assembly protein [Dermatophilus congolensis]